MTKTEEKKLTQLEADVVRLIESENEKLTTYRQARMESARAVKAKEDFLRYIAKKDEEKKKAAEKKEAEKLKKKFEREDKRNLIEIQKWIKKIGTEEALRRVSDM